MLDDFLNFTHTEEFDTASLSEIVTWIDYKKGIRTLFVAIAPDFVPTTIDLCNIEQKETLHTPVLSPSGHYLVYTRGKYHLDGRCEETLIIKDLQSRGRSTIKLPAGKHICFDERRHQIFYTQNQTLNQLSCVCLKQNTIQTLLVLKGQLSALVLCEKTQKLAIHSEESSSSFIMIHCLSKNKTEWVNPNFTLDSTPVWSPSGQHLAFIRHHQSDLHQENALLKSDLPAFSMMVFNVGTNEVHTLWNSQTSIISNQSSQEGQRTPCWLNDQTLVFCHEGCGWEHAYSIDINTRQINVLSTGDFLVRDCTTCPYTETVYLSHNKHRRHHYRIDIIRKEDGESELQTDKLTQALNKTMGFLPKPVGSKGHYIALLNTSNKQPCHLVLFDLQKDRWIPLKDTSPPLTPESIPTHIKPSSHTFKASDGRICHGQLFHPSLSTGPLPAIVYLHDGPGQQSVPGFSPSLEMSFHYAICQYLACQGFLILDLNYRGSGGYNKGFREAKNRIWHGASEYYDVLAAGKWLAGQRNVNAKQVGIMGKGWGGYLTALALARDSQLFHAGVDIHGYHHLPRMMRTTKQPFLNNTLFTCAEAESATRRIACAKLAVEHSPWDRIDDWMSPVLLVNGDNNTQVPFSEGQQLYKALVKQGVQVESLVLPNETHTFTYHTSWKKLARSAHLFFKKHLLNH